MVKKKYFKKKLKNCFRVKLVFKNETEAKVTARYLIARI